MAEAPTTREERLAARLRDNLRRRKEQARARSGSDDERVVGAPEVPSADAAERDPSGDGSIS